MMKVSGREFISVSNNSKLVKKKAFGVTYVPNLKHLLQLCWNILFSECSIRVFYCKVTVQGVLMLHCS